MTEEKIFDCPEPMTVSNEIDTTSTQPPFFIAGCPRSGTTLLQVMLNRHPRLCIPPESKLFFLYDGCPAWLRRRTLARLRREGPAEGLPPLDASMRVEDVMRALAAGHSKYNGVVGPDAVDQPIRFGDKTPEHVYRLDRIDRVYPDSRWIFVVRDARDVAMSLTRMPWMKVNLRGAAALWAATQQRLIVAAARRPEQVLWVSYEALIDRPERELARVLRFLDVAADDHDVRRLLHRSEADRGNFPRREDGWKSHALREIDPTRVRAWRRAAPRCVAMIEQQCRRDMINAGYCPVTPERHGERVARMLGRLSLARALMRLPPAVWCSESYYRLGQLRFFRPTSNGRQSGA